MVLSAALIRHLRADGAHFSPERPGPYEGRLRFRWKGRARLPVYLSFHGVIRKARRERCGAGLRASSQRKQAPAPAGIAAQRDFIRLRSVFVQRDAGILAGLGRVRSCLGFELPAGLQRGRDAVSGLAHMPLLKTPLRHFARVRLFSRAGPFVVPLWRGADDVPARRFSRNGSGPHFVEACPAASCRARCAARRSAGKGAHGSIRRFMVACNGFAARVYQWVGATECRSF